MAHGRLIAPLGDGTAEVVLERGAWRVEDAAAQRANVANGTVSLDHGLEDEETGVGRRAAVLWNDRVDPAELDWFRDFVADPEDLMRRCGGAGDGSLPRSGRRRDSANRDGQALRERVGLPLTARKQ